MYSEKLNLNFLNFKNFGEIKIGNFKKKNCVGGRVYFRYIKTFVLVSLAQLVWTMHKICKVRGSNSGHQKKKIYKNL